MAEQYTGHVIQTETHNNNTALSLVGVLVTCCGRIIILSILSIKNEKLLNSNNNRSKLEFLRVLWDIVVFRLVAYSLNIICLILRN